MTEDDKYYAAVVNKTRDGSIRTHEGWKMIDDCENPEIFEYFNLSMMLEIYENSPEAERLKVLGDKFDTEEIHCIEIW